MFLDAGTWVCICGGAVDMNVTGEDVRELLKLDDFISNESVAKIDEGSFHEYICLQQKLAVPVSRLIMEVGKLMQHRYCPVHSGTGTEDTPQFAWCPKDCPFPIIAKLGESNASG